MGVLLVSPGSKEKCRRCLGDGAWMPPVRGCRSQEVHRPRRCWRSPATASAGYLGLHGETKGPVDGLKSRGRSAQTSPSEQIRRGVSGERGPRGRSSVDGVRAPGAWGGKG